MKAFVMTDSRQTYDAGELDLMARVKAKFAAAGTATFVALESPDKLVSMFSAASVGNVRATVMARTVVDAPFSQAAAWEVLKGSGRKHVKNHSSNGGLGLNAVQVNEHMNVVRAVYSVPVPGSKPREWVQLQIWKRASNAREITVIYHNTEHNRFPIRREHQRASSTIMIKFKELPREHAGLVQTKVTHIEQTSLLGGIPHFLQKQVSVHQLLSVTRMRKEFDESLLLDGVKRTELEAVIRSHASREALYSPEEEAIMEGGRNSFKLFNGKSAKDIVMLSPQTRGKVAFEDGESFAWGWSSTLVRAESVQVLAFVWDVMSRAQSRFDDLEKEVDEAPNAHNQVVYRKWKTPSAIRNRDFVGRMVWKREAGGFMVTTAPANTAKRGKGLQRMSSLGTMTASMTLRKNRLVLPVRGRCPLSMRISDEASGFTKIQLVINLDLGGTVARLGPILRSVVASELRYAEGIQQYFLQLREKADFDEVDGRALGYRLIYPDAENRSAPRKAVARIFKLHKGLSQLAQEFPWIVALIEEVVSGRLSMALAVKTKLECLSELQARDMGKSLSKALRARKTADAGVYQWKNQNPSMVELFKKYPWVEEMITTIGEEVLKNAPWGMFFRVVTGSGLSMIDLATDINVMMLYFDEPGQEGYGWVMLGMVLANFAFSSALVLLQNARMGRRHLLLEVLIVLSGLKPGIDAMRVVQNAKIREKQVFNPKLELTLTKCIEMFCESIPGCILQIHSLLLNGGKGKLRSKLFSIGVSAITTGMSSAAISYDFDADPANRKAMPLFYGYLPDDGTKRGVMYLCMVANGALMLLLRSIGVAMILFVNAKWCIAYFLGDYLLYFVYKLVRADFTYWLPTSSLQTDVLISFTFRLFAKLV
ncbi:hypothetical protein TeGR_g4924, partial [Tetraparma gracilis]